MVSTYDIQADVDRLTALSGRIEAARFVVASALINDVKNRESPEWRALSKKEVRLLRALSHVRDAAGHLSDILEGE